MAKSDELKSLLKEPSIYILTSETATLVGALHANQILSAGEVFKKLTTKFGGKGGGRPDLAQGLIQFNKITDEEIFNSIKEVTR